MSPGLRSIIRRPPSRRFRLVILCVAATLVASTSVILAATPSNPGPFTGCLTLKGVKGLVYNVAQPRRRLSRPVSAATCRSPSATPRVRKDRRDHGVLRASQARRPGSTARTVNPERPVSREPLVNPDGTGRTDPEWRMQPDGRGSV